MSTFQIPAEVKTSTGNQQSCTLVGHLVLNLLNYDVSDGEPLSGKNLTSQVTDRVHDFWFLFGLNRFRGKICSDLGKKQ